MSWPTISLPNADVIFLPNRVNVIDKGLELRVIGYTKREWHW
jgi:hypothetical protein